jgi:hypothetical protein
VLVHRQDTIDVGGPQLEDAGHAGRRRDRLDLHVHRVEDRPFGLRALELEIELPVDLPDDIHDAAPTRAGSLARS